MKKKKYILKKSRAQAVADPIAYFHSKDEDKNHAKALEESIAYFHSKDEDKNKSAPL